jgi:2-iminobutanoate/2-iminopropanoate deaminase
MTEPRYLQLEGGLPIPGPYSHAVAAGDLILVAGQIAADDPDFVGQLGKIEDETRAALDLIGRILEGFGAGFDDVLRVGVFMTDLAGFARMNEVYATYFHPGRQPARTCIGVRELLAGCSIEIDCIARRPAQEMGRSGPAKEQPAVADAAEAAGQVGTGFAG